VKRNQTYQKKVRPGVFKLLEKSNLQAKKPAFLNSINQSHFNSTNLPGTLDSKGSGKDQPETDTNYVVTYGNQPI